MMDTETLMEVESEFRQYEIWKQKKKNQILNMTDSVKKQKRWNELFPRFTQDDSWLEEAVVF
jgi:hypothetical protein